ncbi:MAG: hypothetical protein ACRCXD_06760 [Luteolibacter sp.]
MGDILIDWPLFVERILEMIETLDEVWASAEFEIFRKVARDEEVIGRIVAAQRNELEREIAGLNAEAERVAEDAREPAGEVPF